MTQIEETEPSARMGRRGAPGAPGEDHAVALQFAGEAQPRAAAAGLPASLLARLRAMVRTGVLFAGPEDDAHRLMRRAAELEAWNHALERRVAAQVGEIERVSQLRRFVAPQVAEVVMSGVETHLLASHRREIVVLFCDLRGFTAFAETVEPDEMMAALREYHAVLGPLVRQFEGTLDHFAGDGVMVFFNDPVPCPDPPERAVRLADAIRRDVGALTRIWRRRGHGLGFGVGIAQGFATIGQIGFEHRVDYAAIGSVTNTAARLCAEAANGQILVTRQIADAVGSIADAQSVGALSLKGLAKPVAALQLGTVSPA